MSNGDVPPLFDFSGGDPSFSLGSFSPWDFFSPGLSQMMPGERPSFFDFSGGDISSQMMFTDEKNPGGPPLTLAQVQAIDPEFSMPAGEMGGGALTAGQMPAGTIGGATGNLQTPFGTLSLTNPDGSLNTSNFFLARAFGLLPQQQQGGNFLGTGMSGLQLLSLVGGLGGIGVGLGGIIQGLTGGGPTTKQTSRTILPPQSPAQTASQSAALQALLGGGTGQAGGPTGSQGGSGGLFGQLNQIAPLQQIAMLQALQQGSQNALASGNLGNLSAQMAGGNLPPLSPTLQGQLDQLFSGQEQNINRFVDQSFQGALERARQQGFAGGPEVFREGTPGAILAPSMAEATRQRGLLAGQRAGAELNLQQQLPLQAGNLATLNQNIIQSLYGLGQQGTQNQLAAINALLGISGQGIQQQQAGAGTTVTGQQPFNLLSAFAPTASLLGGVGGLLGSTQPRQTSLFGTA